MGTSQNKIDRAKEMGIENPEQFTDEELTQILELEAHIATLLENIKEAPIKPGGNYIEQIKEFGTLSAVFVYQMAFDVYVRLFKAGCFVPFISVRINSDPIAFLNRRIDEYFEALAIVPGTVIHCVSDCEFAWMYRVEQVAKDGSITLLALDRDYRLFEYVQPFVIPSKEEFLKKYSPAVRITGNKDFALTIFTPDW